jgi:hypothetical protein
MDLPEYTADIPFKKRLKIPKGEELFHSEIKILFCMLERIKYMSVIKGE